jgi:hypothetical protein
MLKYLLIFYIVNVVINILIYRLSKNNTNYGFMFCRSFIPVCTFIPFIQTAASIVIILYYLNYKISIDNIVSYLFKKIFGK